MGSARAVPRSEAFAEEARLAEGDTRTIRFKTIWQSVLLLPSDLTGLMGAVEKMAAKKALAKRLNQ